MDAVREPLSRFLFEQQLEGRVALFLLGWGLFVVVASLVVVNPPLVAGQFGTREVGLFLTGVVFAAWGVSELVSPRRRWLVALFRVGATVALAGSSALIALDVVG